MQCSSQADLKYKRKPPNCHYEFIQMSGEIVYAKKKKKTETNFFFFVFHFEIKKKISGNLIKFLIIFVS